MFDISFGELMLIGVIALIVIGPERLPKVARTVGHLMGRAQRYVNEVKSDIQKEIDLDQIGNLKHQMEDAARSVKSSMSASVDELKSVMEEPATALQDGLDEARKALDTLDPTKPVPSADPAPTRAIDSDPVATPAGDHPEHAPAARPAAPRAPDEGRFAGGSLQAPARVVGQPPALLAAGEAPLAAGGAVNRNTSGTTARLAGAAPDVSLTPPAAAPSTE